MKLWAPRVLGLDLSLTGTGVALIGAQGVEKLLTVRPGRLGGHERLTWILDAIADAQRGQCLDLVVVEGPSYGSQGGQRGHHERAGLWWLVTHGLHVRGRSCAVVAPKARAKFATGNGNSVKSAVLGAVRARYGHLTEVRDDNQADALVLAHMGVAHLGGELAGIDMPAVNSKALDNAAWPNTPADE